MIWLAIGVPVLAVVVLFVFSLCKVSGEADAALERFRREGHI